MTPVAVKFVKPQPGGGRAHLKLVSKEIASLRQIRHPNLIELLEVVVDQDRVYLIMEYCQGGDLRNLLNETIRAA